MANRKITELTALTTPAADDVIPIVDISETGNATKNKKITVGNLIENLADIDLKLANGTEAAPSLAFTSATSTGLYRSAANELSIATNGGQAIKVEANNKTTIYGDLVVTGGTTTISSTQIDVTDKNLQLATGNSSDSGADGGGLTLKGASDKTWNWVDSTDAWTSNQDIDVTTGRVLRIAGTQVLSATTLGAGIVNSSLTSVGTLGSLTVTNAVTAGSLDISGGADIDGTLEADAYTVNGTALNEYIADTVGAMVSSNTETNITVTYDDSDNTLDFSVVNITGNAASADTVDIASLSNNSQYFLVFTDNSGSAKTVGIDSGLEYNPSTNVLHAAGGFSGSGASLTALNADNISSGTLASARIEDNAITRNKISDGEVISSKLDSSAVTTSKINNGAVTNDKVSASAAIAGTKISPNFGSQNVDTSGSVACGNITIANVNPKIFLTDTNNNSDYSILNNNGVFNIKDDTNTATRFYIEADGSANFTGNLDCEAGLDVTGAITATGNLTISNTAPWIQFTDTNTNPDWLLQNSNGAFIFHDGTATRLQLNTDGHVDVTGNLDVGAGVDVTGNITATGNLTISNTAPKILLTDTDHNDDFSIRNDNGTFKIYDETDGTGRLKVYSSGTVEVLGNLDVGAGLDVTGNISVSGTVDGVDVAALNASALKKDGTDNGASTIRVNDADFIVQDSTEGVTNFIWRDHSASKLYLGTAGAQLTPRSSVIPSADSTYDLGSNGTRWANIYGDTISGNFYGNGANITVLNASQLSSGTVAAARLDTATTQSAGNNSTKIATTAYTDTAISNLIDSSPGTLNTLNELAAALGDDANFSTTVTNSIATKLPLAGGSLTGDLSINDNSYIRVRATGANGSTAIQLEHTGAASFTGTVTANAFSGSGASLTNVNATTLDSIDSGSFLRSDANDTSSGTIAFGTGTLDPDSFASYSGGFGNIADGGGWGVRGLFVHGSGTGDAAAIGHNGSALYFGIQDGSNANSMETWLDVTPGTRVINFQTDNNATNVQIGGNKIFHAGNDGAGSGLDADTLDGIGSNLFVRSDQGDTVAKLTFTSSSSYPVDINSSDNGKIVLRGSSNPYIRWRESDTDKAYIQWNSSGFLGLYNQEDASSLLIKDDITFSLDGSTYHKVWHAGNDGSGSGLDADTLDGVQASNFVRGDAQYTLPISSTWNLFNNLNDWAVRVGNTNGTNSYVYMCHHQNGMHIRNDSSTTSTSLLDVYAANGNRFQVRGADGLVTSNSNHMWHAGNDGSGSGVDADLLDGVQSTSFLRSDATDTASGSVTFTSSALTLSGHWYSRFYSGTKNYIHLYPGGHSGNASSTDIRAFNGTDADVFQINGGSATGLKWRGNTIWTAENDGSGSGLDADLLDGQEGSYYRNASNLNAGTVPTARLGSGTASSSVFLRGDGTWTGVSAGDATQLDGLDSTQFVRSDTGDTLSGNYNTTGTWLIGGDYSYNAYNSVSSTRLLFGGGNDPANYHIGTNLENFGGNYTKLDLRWHTGIRMGAQSGYGGIRLYNNEDLNTLVFSVSKNDANTRIESGELYHNTSGTSDVYWHASNDGSGSGLDADTVDGYEITSIYREDSSASATVGAGWITVAENTSGRQHGEIFVSDSDSSDHSFIRIDWMRSYQDSCFTVINCGGHSNRITGVRVLRDSDITYGNKKLQVYVTVSSNYRVAIKQLQNQSGWGNHTVVTPVVQNSISGYQLHGTLLEDLHTYNFSAEDGIQAGTGGIKSFGELISAYGSDKKIVLSGSSNPYIRFQEGTTDKAYIQWNSAGYLYLRNDEDSSVLIIRDNLNFSQDAVNFKKVWNEYNDGSGSGLDADTLDGVEGSNFVRSDVDDTLGGTLTTRRLSVQGSYDIRLANGGWSGESCKIQHHGDWLYIQGGSQGHVFRSGNQNNDSWYIQGPNPRAFYPAADNAYDIGKAASQPRTLYSKHIILGNYSGDRTLSFKVGQNGTSRIEFLDNNSTEGCYMQAVGETNGAKLTFGARWNSDDPKIIFNLTTGSGNGIYPDTNNEIDLGRDGYRWRNGFFQQVTLKGKSETPSHDRGAILLQPSSGGGQTGINFRSNVNDTSDHGYIWWYDDCNEYQTDSNSSGENGLLLIGAQNDGGGASNDNVAIEACGHIWLCPGTDNDQYAGNSGPNSARGRLYYGRRDSRREIDAFPGGTKMLFAQTSAPTGWTKKTNLNDYALRIVSGTAGNWHSGNSFSSKLRNTSQVANHTLSTSQIPSHRHWISAATVDDRNGTGTWSNGQMHGLWADQGSYSANDQNYSYGRNSANTGGGNAHNHNFTFNIQVLDLIWAEKETN